MTNKKTNVSAKHQTQSKGIGPSSDSLELFLTTIKNCWPWLLLCITPLIHLNGASSAHFAPKAFWIALISTITFLFSRKNFSNSIRLTPFGGIWLLYMFWIILSMSWAIQPLVSIDRWLVMFLLSMMYLIAVRTRFWEYQYFWNLFCGLIIVLGTIGCFEFILTELSFIQNLPGTTRPRITFGSRNYVGLFFATTSPLLIWRFYKARGNKETILTMAALALALTMVIFARTRAAWLGIGLSAFFVTVLGIHQHLKNHRTKNRILAALAITVVIAGIFITPSRMMMKNLNASRESVIDLIAASPGDIKNNSRWAIWKYALQIPINRWIGTGYGNFPIAATPYNKTSQIHTLTWEVHNDYLQTLLDLGCIGAAIFIILLLYLLRLSWLHRTDGLMIACGAAIIILMTSMFFSWTIQKLSTHLWIAAVAAMLNHSHRKNSTDTRLSIPVTFQKIACYFTALCLCLLTIVIGFSIKGDKQFTQIMNKNSNFRTQTDFDLLAEEVAPSMHFNYEIVHTFLNRFAVHSYRMKQYDAAKKFATRALKLHPNDHVVEKILGMIAFNEGDVDQAVDRLYRALQLSHMTDNPYYSGMRNFLIICKHAGRTQLLTEVWKLSEANRVQTPIATSPSNGTRIQPAKGFELDWTDCNGALKYEVVIFQPGVKKWPKPIATTTESHCRIQADLKPGETYFWHVSAVGKYKTEGVAQSSWFVVEGNSESSD